jgi:hypothetical protein
MWAMHLEAVFYGMYSFFVIWGCDILTFQSATVGHHHIYP